MLWINDLPSKEEECTSSFHEGNPQGSTTWLSVRKPHVPRRPTPPEHTLDWIHGGEEHLDDYRAEPPELRSEITVVESTSNDPETIPVSAGPAAHSGNSATKTKYLSDYPDIENAWLTYIVDSWLPWVAEMKRLEPVRHVYESLDTMRRRLEEAEETYELIIAVGLLQWRDSTGKSVCRHTITAQAEIDFAADKGTISIVPSATFDACRLELDMLELQDQPRLDVSALEEQLGELDIELWGRQAVGKILTDIANHQGVHSRAVFDTLDKCACATDEFCLSYAPAIVLRQRRPIAYDDLLKGFLAQGAENIPATQPWRVLLGNDSSTAGDPADPSSLDSEHASNSLRYLPLAINDEQESILTRLERSSAVVVKGPPGTGKSHTIANLMCHLLAGGDRILVTAQASKALSVLLGKLPTGIAELCVSSLASSKDDLELLKKSVANILQRRNTWAGEQNDQVEIDKLEAERLKAQSQLQDTLRSIREAREAESYSHNLPGGYCGTAAAIATQLQAVASEFDWIVGSPELNHSFPLTAIELQQLADINSQLTTSRLNELEFDLGSNSLPSPTEFAASVAAYRSASEALKLVSPQPAIPGEAGTDCSHLTVPQIDRIIEELHQLDSCELVGQRLFPQSLSEVTADLLSGRIPHYRQAVSLATAELDTLSMCEAALDQSIVELPASLSFAGLTNDIDRVIEHFRAGGSRGILFFKPTVIRETAYVTKSCRVDGRPVRTTSDFERLKAYVRLNAGFVKLRDLCPQLSETTSQSYKTQLGEWREGINALRQLVDVGRKNTFVVSCGIGKG